MAMIIISCNSISKEKELQINQKYFTNIPEKTLLKVYLRNYLYEINYLTTLSCSIFSVMLIIDRSL